MEFFNPIKRFATDRRLNFRDFFPRPIARGGDQDWTRVLQSGHNEIGQFPHTTPIRSILIANRGEIARRIIRVCREHGIRSVAVFCDADADASHLREADAEVYLGPGKVAETYISPERIAAAAEEAGVDAVHPGYGFLSESDKTARLITEQGRAWIGPRFEVLTLFGDKVKSRHVAEGAGLRVIPGTQEYVDLNGAIAFFEEHGPTMLKWSHGGGGRGVVPVRTLDELREEFPKVQKLADREGGGVFAEKLLEGTRHIEVQLARDKSGESVILGTRDCTVQRRNQKLIEEAPATCLSDDAREEIYEGVRMLGNEVDYHGVGTVEFLMAQDGTCYFLEVNPRVQVEHTVTEETTGIDVIVQQIRIAAGEPLGFSDPEVIGHSIQLRINAESPYKNFTPSSGVVTWVGERAGMGGIRVDWAYREGEEVTPNFDSLVGKIIVWGKNRHEAINLALWGNEILAVRGIETTKPFHDWALDHKTFRRGDHDSLWFEEEFDPEKLGGKPYKVPPK